MNGRLYVIGIFCVCVLTDSLLSETFDAFQQNCVADIFQQRGHSDNSLKLEV